MRRFILPAAGAAFLLIPAALSAQAPLPVETLLDRVVARLESFNPKSNWQASIRSTQIELDRRGRPERTTIQTKTVAVTEGRREEDILSVVRTEDGVTRDITEEYLAERRARWEKYRAQEKARERGKEPARRRSRLGMRVEDFAELLPFSPERRTEFSFAAREGAAPDGRPLYFLDVRAKVKDVENWEGTYTIDAATFTPFHARLTPSETPPFVKEIEVEADFQVFEGVHIIPLRTWVRINAGFLFLKRIRAVSEEVYTDIRVTR